jgi:PBP1b-binding outer membrane lipoprotein LpoB
MTKIMLKTLSAAAVATLLLTGCGQAPAPEVKKEVADFACRQDGVLAPDFTCDPYAEGSIVGLGVAKMNAGNDKSMQRTEAMGSARDGLARQISVKVSNLFKSFKSTTGSGNAATFDKATSDVSKQLASQTLNGSKQVGKSWRHPKTNELFLMVGISNAPVKAKMEEAVKTSFKNDKAMYQNFLASKANGELDKELEKAGK